MTEQQQCNSLEDILDRHDRERFAFERMTPVEQQRHQVEQYKRYISDPWAFLSDCVYTLDQVNQQSPIKAYPSYLEYTHFLVKLWQRERKIAVPKSRRMICSWTFISCYAWDTFFHPGRFNAFVSKKEDDSADLVSRAEFIYHHIPEWRIPKPLLPVLKNGKMSKQPPLLEFEEIHSKIQGFPQGSDQMRQFTLSGILNDEWAFWEQGQAAYSASLPTLDGGGRITGISSRSPGFFKKIVFDQLDALDLTFRETPPVPAQKVMEGVEVWRNPRNGFVIVDLHYTADPKKRSHEWREAIRKAMPARDFAMEYEKSWQTFEGKPVYEDFNKGIHIGTARVEPGVPLLLGWDFGLTPACILAQLVGRQLRIIREFVETNGSISKLAPVVYQYIYQNFPASLADENNLISYVDPAGFQKAQTDERTCVDVMRKCGFRRVLPGPVGWEARKKSVEDYLTKTYGEGPGLLVDEGGCPILIEGFNGGFRYPEKAIDIEPTMIRPIKNKYSHPHDALQYLAHGATALRRSYGIKEIPVPTYGFQQRETPTEEKNPWLANLMKPTASNT